MKISLKPIIPKSNQFNSALYQRLIEQATVEVWNGVKKDFESTVSTWQSKPRFGMTRKGNTWYVSTKNDVYSYVDRGTKGPYLIPKVIKPGVRLAYFKKGFRAKTRPGIIGSSAGRAANSDFRRPKQVSHPGIKPRGFSKKIKEKWARVWRDKVALAIRRASRG